MAETIRLIGGPFAGQTYAWDGGDEVQVADIPVVSLRPGPPDPRRRLLRHETYRRSLNNPALFVCQP